jgi:hypothetical protein
VNFYFEEKRNAELLKNELEGSIFGNYEIQTEWIEKKAFGTGEETYYGGGYKKN